MKHRHWLWLILLTAVCLRLYALTDVPPGLTHDEADHGLSAWQVVEGSRQLYFTIGYGREPLFDYSTAVLMHFLGPTYLAGRLTAVFFSLILTAGMYRWTRQTFDAPTALLTTAGLAVAFWPVMAGRQMLRSVTLPALFVLAAYFFWRGCAGVRYPIGRIRLSPFVVAGLLLGSTFYTYIPARLLWLIFPVMLGYWAWRNRPLFRQIWPGVTAMLVIAGGIGAPLFYYLYTHPAAETRIRQLSQPLTAAAAGNLTPLLDNIGAGLRLFTIAGDTAWRYNIAGRPWLDWGMGLLFYLGIGVALWHLVRSPTAPTAAASLFALTWLILGLVPVLVTGPALSMTQAIGMQPVLYLFPALSLTTIGRRLPHPPLQVGLAVLIFGGTAVLTARDYFGRWANHPAVRVQYETTMTTAMRYLKAHDLTDTAVSTITPGPFHTPALAQLILPPDAVNLRWFDARASLIWPHSPAAALILPGFTPLAPELQAYFEAAVLVDTLPLRQTDLDRPLDIYTLDGPAAQAALLTHFTRVEGVQFGEVVELLGYDWPSSAVSPGAQTYLVTLWRVKRPLADAVLFTQVLGTDGLPLAQADQLDVPGYAWHPGDLFAQLHHLTIPPETAAGSYPLVIGLYTRPSQERVPVHQNQTPTGDHYRLDTLTVSP